MMTESSCDGVLGALKAALPYVRLYRGKPFVLKLGGASCADRTRMFELAHELATLRELGLEIVVVHGGGPQTTALSRELGLEPRQVGGRRVTCPRTLDIAVMTLNGSVNTALLAACRAAGLAAIGLSGIDAACVRARRRAPAVVRDAGAESVVDFGLVGDIVAVDGGVLGKLLAAGFLPVLAPLAADDQGQVLNVNADSVAAAVAKAIGAQKLVFMTEAPGILEDPGDPTSLISYTDIAGLERLVARGLAEGGMMPKVEAITDALRGGVPRVHVISSTRPDSLLEELFTNEGAGTLIVSRIADLSPEEQAAGQRESDAEGMRP